MLCGTCQTELPVPADVTERYVTCTECGTTTDVALEHTEATSSTSRTYGPLNIPIDLTGETLGRGTYLVEAKIGQGGMGQVYRGRHLRLDQEVAIKIISPQLAAEEEFIARFQREGQTLGRIRHEGVVRVLDANRENDLHYLVMEYVRGPEGKPTSLRDLIRNGPLEPKRALTIVAQACDALSYIHGMGIIHRDIKPGNFLINEQGRALVADFGIATVRGVPGEHTYTATGSILGDPTYMSPEQRVNPKGVDNRTDVYSLGLLLYEILVGDVPQGHFEPPSVARRDSDGKSSLPKFLDDVVLKALKQAPEARYASMEEFGEAVRRAMGRLDGSGKQRSLGKTLLTAAAVIVFVFAGTLLVVDIDTRRGWLESLRGTASGEETPEPLAEPVTEPESEASTVEAPEATPEPAGTATPEAFELAVRGGDVAAIERMLNERPALLNEEWPSRTPPLHVAVVSGHANVLDLLVARGADTESREPELGRAALHLAAAQGDSHLAKLLLQAFADANVTDRLYDTPLHLAVREKRLGTIQLLLDYGADPGVRNTVGETPVELAKAGGMIDIAENMERIVVAKNPPDAGIEPVSAEAPAGVVIEAPQQGPPNEAPEIEPPQIEPQQTQPNEHVQAPVAASPYPLHEAAATGSLEEFRRLVKSGIYDVNQQRPSDGNTPMHIAAERGRKSWVQCLLDNGGANSRNTPNHAKKLPINLASENNHNETRELLLEWKSPGVAGW